MALTFAVILPPGLAQACPGPFAEEHHYPACTIPLPDADEVVTIVEGHPAEQADLRLGDEDARPFLVQVDIAGDTARNYIVLTSYYPTIWVFTGKLDQISRVIVLGATGAGPLAAGVVGVPAEKVHFTDPTPLPHTIPISSCTRLYEACSPAQWFGEHQDVKTFIHPPSSQPWLGKAERAGWYVPPDDHRRADVAIARPSRDPAQASGPIDPAEVISPLLVTAGTP
ncbi:hypothetical protein [Neotabrizicola sp. sgz301269]|uniref:hypothetical protein n=1 Tax=Neotabrizicola sp. sgz301269 TaxID=3276282 RepID=UPI00376F9D86